MNKLLGFGWLVLGLGIGALFGQSFERGTSMEVAKQAYKVGYLEGCNTLLHGVNAYLAPFPLECKEYKDHVVLSATGSTEALAPHLDVHTGKDVN